MDKIDSKDLYCFLIFTISQFFFVCLFVCFCFFLINTALMSKKLIKKQDQLFIRFII